MMAISRYHILLDLTAVLILASGCTEKTQTPASQQAASRSKAEITIAAVGDVMMPESIQKAVARNENNYELLFAKVVPDLGNADITIANLETMVDETRPVSGYPRFNAGIGLLSALKKAGVDIVSIANNHVMDAGVQGLKRTMDNISAAGLRYIGAGRTKAEAEEILSLSIKGTKIALLAYTYDANRRLPGAKQSDPGVNVLRVDSEADLLRCADRVRLARTSADLVIVSLHWGDEYAVSPTAWQRKVARELIEAGADMILGHHPHVLQPIEKYTSGDGRQCAVAFSLGNFISSQNYGITYDNKHKSQALRGDSVILYATIKKESGKASMERIELLPVWSLRDQVGGSTVYRPVVISREIERLRKLPKRTQQEVDLLKLLEYRQQLIIGKFTPRMN